MRRHIDTHARTLEDTHTRTHTHARPFCFVEDPHGSLDNRLLADLGSTFGRLFADFWQTCGRVWVVFGLGRRWNNFDRARPAQPLTSIGQTPRFHQPQQTPQPQVNPRAQRRATHLLFALVWGSPYLANPHVPKAMHLSHPEPERRCSDSSVRSSKLMDSTTR